MLRRSVGALRVDADVARDGVVHRVVVEAPLGPADPARDVAVRGAVLLALLATTVHLPVG